MSLCRAFKFYGSHEGDSHRLLWAGFIVSWQRKQNSGQRRNSPSQKNPKGDRVLKLDRPWNTAPINIPDDLRMTQRSLSSIFNFSGIMWRSNWICNHVSENYMSNFHKLLELLLIHTQSIMLTSLLENVPVALNSCCSLGTDRSPCFFFYWLSFQFVRGTEGPADTSVPALTGNGNVGKQVTYCSHIFVS